MKIFLYTLLFLAINVGIMFLFGAVYPENQELFGAFERAAKIMVIIIVLAILQLITGLIILYRKRTPDTGWGILIAAMVVLIFGIYFFTSI